MVEPQDNQPTPPSQGATQCGVAKVQAQHQQVLYSGPIPPPDVLAQYNNVVPGADERILKMAEEQSNHRQYLEKAVISSDITQARWGVICGLIVALAF